MKVKDWSTIVKQLNIKIGKILPILSCYRIEDNKIRVDNLEISIEIKLPEEVQDMCIPIVWFKHMLKNTPKDFETTLRSYTTAIEGTENVQHWVEVSFDGNFFIGITKTEDIKDFPAKHKDSGTPSKLTKQDILNIKAASKITVKDECRPTMEAVYVGDDIVGTNGHSLIKLPVSEPTTPYLIHHNHTKHLKGGYDVETFLNKSGETKRIKLTQGGKEINIMCVEGVYPRYNSVIPTQYSTLVVKVNRQVLLDSLLCVPKNNKHIKFTLDSICEAFGEDKFTIKLNQICIIIHGDAKYFQFLIPTSRMAVMLSMLTEDVIEIGFNDAVSIIKIGDGFVMPVTKA